ncbi:MAG: hypothetical protein J6K58_11890 [Lachnospiraceae bacterium]|nr:hypothetical protein [Lachnospiraceae bacterium]
MKKGFITLRRLLIISIFSVVMLTGCGSNDIESEMVMEAQQAGGEEEVAAIEETMEEVEEKNEVTEETEIKEKEETSTVMPEAQVTTTVADITEFAQYMANLDPKTPHVVIWNEAEGYLIDIKDGEYYQMKEEDRIFESDNNEIDAVWTTIPQIESVGMSEAFEIIPDYTKFDSPHECIFGIYLKEDPDTPIYITYYLDAPVE